MHAYILCCVHIFSDSWSDWEIVAENIAKEQNFLTVDNLKPSSSYEFRVIAHNRFGAGLVSVPSNNVVMPQQRMFHYI